MENNSVTKLILGFLVLIVGLSLIGTVAQQSNSAIDKLGIANETFDIAAARLADGCGAGSINATYPFTIANYPTGWKIADCPIESVVIKNQTLNTATVTTDYLFFSNNGTFYLLNTTTFTGTDCASSGNITTADYLYCPDTYINVAWGRSVLTLVSGFFALALLGVAVGLFYSVAKDFGIIS